MSATIDQSSESVNSLRNPPAMISSSVVNRKLRASGMTLRSVPATTELLEMVTFW